MAHFSNISIEYNFNLIIEMRMNNEVSQPETHHSFNLPAPIAGPVLAWSIVSLAALSVFALRLPLWARVPPPPEQFALWDMLVVQVVFTSLLFPWLFSNLRAALTIGLGSGLMLHLCRALADTTASRTVSLMALLWGVQAALFLLSRSIRSNWAQHVAVACVSSAIIGGLVLTYLRVEFAGSW